MDTFCTGFIDAMLKRKCLLDYTNLFSPNENEKNHKIILKYFQYLETKKEKMKKIYCIKYNKYRNFLKH